MTSSPAVTLVAGASSGLGAALALELADRGDTVLAVGRDREKLDSLAKQAGENKVIPRRCDLGKHDEVAALVRETLELAPVRHIFYSAGTPAFAKPSGITEDLLEEALSANLRGLVYLTSLLVESMKEQGGGTIVGILSTAALTGRRDEGAYAAAKWGARGYLECLRADCKGTGVRVLSVFPGGMNTPFWSKQSHLDPDLDTYMNPREVAHAVIDAATGIRTTGFISSLKIERG